MGPFGQQWRSPGKTLDRFVSVNEIHWHDMRRLSQGQVHLMFQLFPVSGSRSQGKVLSDAYFEPREGCRMTMYQDADTPDHPIFRGVTEPDGSSYTPTRLWLDLFQSLSKVV